MDFRHHVFSVHVNRSSFWGAQRHMQHGSLLGDIDLLAAKHRVDSLFQSGLFGELKQKLKGLGCRTIAESRGLSRCRCGVNWLMASER